MTTEALIVLIQFALKFGIDAAIAIAGVFKSNVTIDDAIAALEVAKTKSAADYLAEAQAKLNPPTV